MAEVRLEHVEKQYPNGFKAITDLNLDIADGEFLVMVGPSGCGKSTTLRMIAGLETISAGELRIGERVVNDVSPRDRDIAMVFQNYALYPHMTVADNMGFALRLAKTPRAEIKERVAQVAHTLELSSLLDRKPSELSGGQRQRVAMGRALVRQPQVFLLDEPLSNLDAKLRVQMRAEISAIQHEVGVTSFYVTHDQVEAMTMADRVAVIKAGILQQVDTPQALYDFPDNQFVAAFIGSPSMNLLEASLSQNDDGSVQVQLGSHSLTAPEKILGGRPALKAYLDGRPVVVGLRPEAFADASVNPEWPESQRIEATIQTVEALGFEKIVHFKMDATQVFDEEALDLPEGAEVPTAVAGALVTGRFSPASPVQVADTLKVNVDMGAAHFFDPATKAAIRD